MPLVKIDMTKLLATTLAILPAATDKQRILHGLGAAGMQFWKKLAQDGLKASSRDYVAGIQLEESGNNVSIALTGRIPNMIENGWEGGDLRQWLLNGPNTKHGKNGPYNTIPFRHGTPGSSGRNVGQAMPQAIHDVAKKLAPTISRPGTAVASSGGRTTVWGQRLNPSLPMKAQARQILNRTEQPWHTTSIYMGMVRNAKSIAGGGSKTSGYTTFRRISLHSNAPGKHWIHPGIKARRFAVATREHIASMAQAIVMQAMGGSK